MSPLQKRTKKNSLAKSWNEFKPAPLMSLPRPRAHFDLNRSSVLVLMGGAPKKKSFPKRIGREKFFLFALIKGMVADSPPRSSSHPPEKSGFCNYRRSSIWVGSLFRRFWWEFGRCTLLSSSLFIAAELPERKKKYETTRDLSNS